MAWTVVNAHYPGLFVGGFLFFIGFARATAAYQAQLDMKTPLLVGFFLAGLVIHGGLQGWWIAPVLTSLSQNGLFWGATILTAFNDNALITFLATLVPNLSEGFKIAVVEGAVTGGGLTVIANAPNPAGQALLGKFFDNAIRPMWLFAAALVPTLIAAAAFRLRLTYRHGEETTRQVEEAAVAARATAQTDRRCARGQDEATLPERKAPQEVD